MRVIDTENIPVKLWLDDIDDNALEQALGLAKLPFAYHHIAIMPDAHFGYGMPIGGVLATVGAIVPNAVGVDIGCGVCAVPTSLDAYGPHQIKDAMALMRQRIPVGFSHHSEAQAWPKFNEAPALAVVEQELKSAQKQLGTLGGGNHFLEIQRSELDGKVWLMLHSGSRNFGLKIAKHYHDLAKKLCERWYSDIPNPDLAFLPLDTEASSEYIAAMDFALAFAAESRSRMMSAMMSAMSEAFPGIVFGNKINVHHNYARMESHFGRNVMVHRKGATSARSLEPGLIPGSQGTASYVVSGLGCKESFMSCSHGAGRKMGRKQACRELDLTEEIRKLDAQGIVHGIRTEKDLDEAAGAYKDIDIVMANQRELVEIKERLLPVAVIKA